MTIVWDFNGTLLCDMEACVDSLNVLLRARKLPCVDLDYYRSHFLFPVVDFYRSLGMAPEKEQHWEALAESFHMHYLFSKKLSLQQGALETVRLLHAHQIKQGVLSALEQGILEVQLQQYGLAESMDFICGSRNYDGASKIEAARALGLQGPVTLVGDTLHDAEVAQALGWQCVLCSAGHQRAERLVVAGVPIIESLAALPAMVFPSENA